MLSDRWRKADWSDQVWEAKIPNFADPAKSIIMRIERLRSGACDVVVYCGEEDISPLDSMAGDLDAAAHLALVTVRTHFQNHRKGSYVLQFTPYRKDREIKEAMTVSQSTANDWRRRNMPMTRKTTTLAMILMGIRAYGRGRSGGEFLSLEPADWDQQKNA